ncbi:hypothetical protein D9M70_589400 [compost metagenome]
MQQSAGAVTILLVQCLDQHFNGPAHLLAQGVGHRFLVLQGFVEQRRQRFVLGTEEAGDTQQRDEGLQGLAFLAPQACVPTGVGHHRAHGRIDQHPALTIGDESESTAAGPT